MLYGCLRPEAATGVGSVLQMGRDMHWVAIFDNSQAMPEVRAKYEPDHFEYLRAHRTEILLAGGLREGPGHPFGGGLWILAVSSKERAVELVESDPYFLHSRRNYKILQWGKRFRTSR
ncbi:YciI family protein [Ramlibacter sp. MMS24-I3-19]|uniref:YciI family protein n=1 Tax=Ramlibacter sp. MMS24-I3-19 TaxID=3416606 RepID=UPI003CFEF47F